MTTLMMGQAGERLVLGCASARIERLVREAGGSAWTAWSGSAPDVTVTVSDDRRPFDVDGWSVLTRGAYHRDGAVTMTDACGSGFDVRMHLDGSRLCVEARYRPSHAQRALAVGLPWRHHLLARAVLLQYPALWTAGLSRLAPLHAAPVTVGDRVALLAGPGGVGRSTLLLDEVRAGAAACTDNLCVSDGRDTFGLVEPVRVEGGTGRRMPHGRREGDLPGRVDMLRPSCIVALRRGTEPRHAIHAIGPTQAIRTLVSGTLMAGELRRYWPYAATLALGTGRGPVVPEVQRVAEILASRLPAVEITLGTERSPTLRQMLAEAAEILR